MSTKQNKNITENPLSALDKKRIIEARRLYDKQQFSDSVSLLNDVINSNPELADAYYLLGICYIKEKKYLEAAAALKKSTELSPDTAEYQAILGDAYFHVGSTKLAIKSYKQALELNDKNISGLVGFANLYFDSENYSAALELYKQVEEITPGMNGLQLHLSLCYSDRGDFDIAIKYAKKALRQSPKCSNTIGRVGKIYLTGGDIKQAIKYFRKALDVNPVNGVAYYELVSLEKIRDKNDPLIRRMENSLKKGMVSFNRRAMHFALGKAYNDCQQWDKAINNFNKGNCLVLSTYDRKLEMKFMRGAKKIFKRNFFEKFRDRGNPSAIPVFIVGMPRSGSTLIDQIISSHSKVYSVGESKALSEIVISVMAENNYKGFPECMDTVSSDFMAGVSSQYLDTIKEQADDAKRVINKMLFNFIYLGLIAILYPNAKIIHSKRNPLDTCLSIYFTNFTSDAAESEWGSSLGNIGFYYKNYYTVMKHWEDVLPIDILDIQYEETVDDLENQARKIIDFCGLEWESECLEFYKSKRSVHTASVSQVRQPIYKSSVSRWPPYSKYLVPLVEELGDIVKDDYEQLRELGCDFKNKKGLFDRLFK